MARALCDQCEYPTSHCVCKAVSPVQHKTRFIVLQHKAEAKNAKNTLKLFNLVSENVEVHQGQTPSDFAHLQEHVSSKSVLLFPSDNIQNVTLANDTTSIETIFVIDANWKKAKMIYLTSPWLQALPHFQFSKAFEQNYKIRKTSVEQGLSTLEACAYSLEEIEAISPQPFLSLLDYFKEQFIKQMPENVKQRYL